MLSSGRGSGFCEAAAATTSALAAALAWTVMANFAEAPLASEAGVHPQPAEAVAEAVGHYRTDQPRGLGMVTNAGSQLAANDDRSHTGHLRRNGRPPAGYREFRPSTREQARYRPLDPACLERS